MENVGGALRGMYRDTIINAENQLVFDSGWISNTIVINGRVLLAALMKGDQNASGIYCMKVGMGSETWGNNPRQPAVSLTDLVKPYKKQVTIDPETDISYLDDKDNKPDQPTHRLEVRVVLGKDFPEKNKTCELREFGLFGRFDRDLRMINCVRHPIIQKAASETLIRVVRLFF
jgi:hypothetical protein